MQEGGQLPGPAAHVQGPPRPDRSGDPPQQSPLLVPHRTEVLPGLVVRGPTGGRDEGGGGRGGHGAILRPDRPGRRADGAGTAGARRWRRARVTRTGAARAPPAVPSPPPTPHPAGRVEVAPACHEAQSRAPGRCQVRRLPRCAVRVVRARHEQRRARERGGTQGDEARGRLGREGGAVGVRGRDEEGRRALGAGAAQPLGDRPAPQTVRHEHDRSPPRHRLVRLAHRRHPVLQVRRRPGPGRDPDRLRAPSRLPPALPVRLVGPVDPRHDHVRHPCSLLSRPPATPRPAPTLVPSP
ncbi:hypothetical protein GA0115246_1145013 [Streptomyces sp. SolWspMP-sol7th]|nr:hypothetical protein GA0115246_1145013 [Streptomyces sp. SolWspMP-sol7th]